MKRLNLNDIMMQNLSVGGTLKEGCYKGTVVEVEKIMKNNKSYINVKINIKGVVHSWRVFDINKFKLEYQLATGKTLKKMGALKGQEIQFYAKVEGRFNKFSMLRFLPEVGVYEVTYGGCAVSEEYNAYIIKLIFDENFTYYDIKYIDSEEAITRFANYTMSSIAYQFGYTTEFKIAELEDHAGEPLVVNVIKKEEYKTPFINYDVIKVVPLDENTEDEIENQDDIDEEI